MPHPPPRNIVQVLVTNKLMSADAAKQVVDGGARRIYRVDQHIGESCACCLFLVPEGCRAGRWLAMMKLIPTFRIQAFSLLCDS